MTKRKFAEALSEAKAQGVTDAETYELEEELDGRVDRGSQGWGGVSYGFLSGGSASQDAADIAVKLDEASLTDTLAVLAAVEGVYNPVGLSPLAFGGLK